MHTNGLPVRYVGQLTTAAYVRHTKEFLSLRHAVESFRDLPLGYPGDTMTLWRVYPHDSAGEAHSRTNGPGSHKLTRGPRGGVHVERIV